MMKSKRFEPIREIASTSAKDLSRAMGEAGRKVAELEGKVTIAKLNVDENPGVAGTYGIRSIPTLMLFKDGKLASSHVGASPKGELKKWITGAI